MGPPEVIVVDSSALLAMQFGEPEQRLFSDLILADAQPCIPATCLVEVSIGVRRRGEKTDHVAALVRSARLEVISIDPDIAAIARDADIRFGRGTGHPARLNFGDCFSYAVAKHLGAPLLFKGDDFIHTDIESALPA